MRVIEVPPTTDQVAFEITFDGFRWDLITFGVAHQYLAGAINTVARETRQEWADAGDYWAKSSVEAHPSGSRLVRSIVSEVRQGSLVETIELYLLPIFHHPDFRAFLISVLANLFTSLRWFTSGTDRVSVPNQLERDPMKRCESSIKAFLKAVESTTYKEARLKISVLGYPEHEFQAELHFSRSETPPTARRLERKRLDAGRWYVNVSLESIGPNIAAVQRYLAEFACMPPEQVEHASKSCPLLIAIDLSMKEAKRLVSGLVKLGATAQIIRKQRIDSNEFDSDQ